MKLRADNNIAAKQLHIVVRSLSSPNSLMNCHTRYVMEQRLKSEEKKSYLKFCEFPSV